MERDPDGHSIRPGRDLTGLPGLHGPGVVDLRGVRALLLKAAGEDAGFFLLPGFHGGNVGLVLAQDMVGFYLCFAVMTFSAYPLVIHDETPEARRAGTIYILLAVIGEA
jgi:hypothetical protein